MKTQTPRIAVYGAGVSGLIASYYLLKKGFLVDVIDPYGDVTIQSVKTDSGLVEYAANSILTNGPVLSLVKEIGVPYYFYFKAGKNKYVFTKGKASKWPLSFKETILNFRKLVSFVRKDEQMRPLSYETVDKWGKRVLSNPVIENLIGPALQGIYGAKSKEVSAKLAFGHLFDGKKTRVKNKQTGSISFPRGMGQFQNALREYLIKNGVVFKKASDEACAFSVVSTPAHSLPDCVSEKNKSILNKVSYKRVSTMTVFVKESDRMPFEGFGCVFQGEPRGVLGMILNSDLFDGRAKIGLVSETWIMDGECVFDEETALETICDVRKTLFNLENKVVSSYYKYWEKAFPNYSVELEYILNDLEPQERVDFFANWTGSLGIGSMIKNGEGFAEEVFSKVSGQSK